VRTAASAPAAEQTTEEAGELLLDVLHDTVDVRAAGARLPALTPGILVPGLARFIPCHDLHLGDLDYKIQNADERRLITEILIYLR
jgi:hypothetical protein